MQFWVPRCSGVSVNGSKGLSGCALRARARVCVCARVYVCVLSVRPSVCLSVGILSSNQVLVCANELRPVGTCCYGLSLARALGIFSTR